jgi:hypothetical protein
MAGWRLRFRAEEHGSHSPSHFFQASNVGVARWWQLAGDGLEGGGLAGGRVATWQQRWGGVWAAATWKVVACSGGMGSGGLQRGMRWSEIVVVAAVFFFPSGMRHGVKVGRVLLFPRGSARCCTGNTLLLSTRRYRVPVVSVSADRIRLPSNPARVQSPLEPMRTERRVHSSTTIAFWWHASWQSFASHLFAREDIFISSINCTIYGPFV